MQDLSSRSVSSKADVALLVYRTFVCRINVGLLSRHGFLELLFGMLCAAGRAVPQVPVRLEDVRLSSTN
eukprot:6200806-Pleurochrysis_carterae.AAC.2